VQYINVGRCSVKITITVQHGSELVYSATKMYKKTYIHIGFAFFG